MKDKIKDNLFLGMFIIVVYIVGFGGMFFAQYFYDKQNTFDSVVHECVFNQTISSGEYYYDEKVCVRAREKNECDLHKEFHERCGE